MSSIHLDVETLYHTGQHLLQSYAILEEYIYSLRLIYFRLAIIWQGSDAEQFLADFHRLISETERKKESLFILALSLIHQAEAWQESDQRFAQTYRSIFESVHRHI